MTPLRLLVVVAVIGTAAVLPGRPAQVPAPAASHPAAVAQPQALAAQPQQLAVARPKAAAVRAAAPRPTRPPTRRVATQRAVPAPRAAVAPATKPLTKRQLMWQAIARIPGYQPGLVTWSLSTRYPNWGMSVLGQYTVYISPNVPAARMYDVVVHEWSHHLSVLPYGDYVVAKVAMSLYFGGDLNMGAERAADCMARELGATWTHYTACTNVRWRAGAAQLLAGLPV